MFQTKLIEALMTKRNQGKSEVIRAVTSNGAIAEIDLLIDILRTAMQYQHLHDTAVYVDTCTRYNAEYDAKITAVSEKEKDEAAARAKAMATPMAILSALYNEPPRKIGRRWTHWANDVFISNTEYDPRHLNRKKDLPFARGTDKYFVPKQKGFDNKALKKTIEILKAVKDDPKTPMAVEIDDVILNGDFVTAPEEGHAMRHINDTRLVRQFKYFDDSSYFERMDRFLRQEEVRLNRPDTVTRCLPNPEEGYQGVRINTALLYETLQYARLVNTPKSDVQKHQHRRLSAHGLNMARMDTTLRGLRRIMEAEDTETVLWRACQLRRELGSTAMYISTDESQLTIATEARRHIAIKLTEQLINPEIKGMVPARLAPNVNLDAVERARRKETIKVRNSAKSIKNRMDKYTAAAKVITYNPATGVLTRDESDEEITGVSINVRVNGKVLNKTTLVKYCIKNQGLLPDAFSHLSAEDIVMTLAMPDLNYPDRVKGDNLSFSFRHNAAANQQQPTTLGLIRAYEDIEAAQLVRYDISTGKIFYKDLFNGREISYRRQVSVKGHQISYDLLIILCLAQNRQLCLSLPDTIKDIILTPANAHLMRLRMLPHSGDHLPTPDRFVIEVAPKFERYYQDSKGLYGPRLPSLADLQAFRPYSNASASTEPYADSGTDLDAFEEYLKKRQELSDCPLV